jgi:hypothetical protein
MRWLRERLNVEDEQGVQILQDLRKMREEQVQG